MTTERRHEQQLPPSWVDDYRWHADLRRGAMMERARIEKAVAPFIDPNDPNDRDLLATIQGREHGLQTREQPPCCNLYDQGEPCECADPHGWRTVPEERLPVSGLGPGLHDPNELDAPALSRPASDVHPADAVPVLLIGVPAFGTDVVGDGGPALSVSPDDHATHRTEHVFAPCGDPICAGRCDQCVHLDAIADSEDPKPELHMLATMQRRAGADWPDEYRIAVCTCGWESEPWAEDDDAPVDAHLEHAVSALRIAVGGPVDA